MIALLRSEWFKLRTLRLNYALPLLGFGFVIVILGLIGIFGDVDGFSSPISSDVANIVGITAVLPGLLISVVGVLSISAEFGHGTIRPTLVATPDRPKVFLAKAMVLSVIAFVSGLVTALVGYLVGYVLLTARGAEELRFLDDDGTVWVLFGGLPILFVLLVLFGFSLGLLIRISAAAVSIVILWPILIETIFIIALNFAGFDDPQKFMPYQSALAMVTSEPDSFANGRVGGGLFFGAVIVVLLIVATLSNIKRDV